MTSRLAPGRHDEGKAYVLLTIIGSGLDADEHPMSTQQ